MAAIFFKSEGHKERFTEVMQGRLSDGKYDPKYGAAFFVLTSNLNTWNKAQDYMEPDSILFEEMLQDMDWSGGNQVLLQWAANLFSERAIAPMSPVELMRLDDDNFKVAVSALIIRRYGLQVDDLHEI